MFCSFGGVPNVGRARVVGTFHVHEGPEWREKASGFASEPGGEACGPPGSSLP